MTTKSHATNTTTTTPQSCEGGGAQASRGRGAQASSAAGGAHASRAGGAHASRAGGAHASCPAACVGVGEHALPSADCCPAPPFSSCDSDNQYRTCCINGSAGRTPSILVTSSPPLNRTSVGSPLTPNLVMSAGYLSESI